MIKNKVVPLQNLKSIVRDFVDNNGDNTCFYYYGAKLSNLSDNSNEAFISLQTHPQSTYDFFIQVQDELAQSYCELRVTYAVIKFGKSTDDLSSAEIKILKDVYPFKLSEEVVN